MCHVGNWYTADNLPKRQRGYYVSRRCRIILLAGLAMLAGERSGRAAAQGPSAGGSGRRDLAALSLEELSQIEVTSFRNKAQKLGRVAGAVYVITRDEIERSGLSSVPELLRLVPGLHVAQVNGSQWSIGSRGTAGVMQPRLLVLIDGRSIYTPVFSGVFWDMGMPMLEDIERIEVIRGPGATIWGANAVLGVINIVTRSSKDTQGGLAAGGVGSRDRGSGRVRFGGSAKGVSWRAYALAEDHAALSKAGGESANDGWNAEQAGFRMDGERERASWMLEGSASTNFGRLTNQIASLDAQGFVAVPMSMLNSAGNLTGEYRRAVARNGELRVNVYFDQVRRQNTVDRIAHTRTWNGEVRYDFAVRDRHSMSAGLGVRAMAESVPGTGGTAHFNPSEMEYANYNGFAQDEISLLGDRVFLTLGAKLEHNPFTHWGLEPSSSLLWEVNRHHSVWVSAARALRTPSFVERAIDSPLLVIPASAQTGGLPVEVDKRGSALFGNENVTDYQAGYRGEVTRALSLSVSVYRDRYQHLRSVTTGSPGFQRQPIPSLLAIASFTNYTDGNGKGIESTLAWQPRRWGNWRLEGSHTYGTLRLWAMATAPAGTLLIDAFNPPRNQWTLRPSWNLTRRIEADMGTFWTGHTVSRSYLGDVDSPAYARVDVRIGYKVGERWTVSVTGQNLLTPRHVEGMPETLTGYSYVTRGVSLSSVWRF
jgi:iron complex outermembrane recepter protein